MGGPVGRQFSRVSESVQYHGNVPRGIRVWVAAAVWAMAAPSFAQPIDPLPVPAGEIARRLTQPAGAEAAHVDLDIQFGLGSAEIDPSAFPQMDAIAEALKSNALRSTPLLIQGHTDNIGSEAYNLDLSLRRATSVKTMLVEGFDIAADRLEVQGLGESRPLESNATLAGRRRNRRITLLRAPERDEGPRLSPAAMSGAPPAPPAHDSLFPPEVRKSTKPPRPMISLQPYRRPELIVRTPDSAAIAAVAFSPGGERLATASEGAGARIWTFDGSLARQLAADAPGVSVSFDPGLSPLPQAGDFPTDTAFMPRSLAFSPDGRMIAAAGRIEGMVKPGVALVIHAIRLWSVDGPAINTIETKTEMFDVAFGDDGQTVLGASSEGIQVWSLEGEVQRTVETPLRGPVAFRPDGRAFVSAGEDGNIELRNLGGRLLHPFHRPDGPSGGDFEPAAFAFSPRGGAVAAAGNVSASLRQRLWMVRHVVRIWDAAGNVLRTLEAPEEVRCLSFGAGGDMIAVGLRDSTVELWDLTGNRLDTLVLE